MQLSQNDNEEEPPSGVEEPEPSEEYLAHILGARLSFALPESLPYITQMRRAARSFMHSLGIAQQDTEDAELILGELAANAIRHAHGDNYHIAIELLQDQMTIIVTDNGTGFPAGTLPEPGTARPDELADPGKEDSEEQTRFGGFGLPLLYALADKIDIRPNKPQGSIISATKKLRIGTFNDEVPRG